MTKLLRFPDLKHRNIVRNWPTLLRLINREGFPAGVRLGSNMRAWPEDEIEAWIESRRIVTPDESLKEQLSVSHNRRTDLFKAQGTGRPI